MAVGRGEFFQSFLAGLQRLPVQPAPGREQPNCGRGRPGSGGTFAGQERGRPGGRRKRRINFEQSSVSGTDPSNSPSNATMRCPEKEFPVSKENLIERLPSEILIRILSYLDVSSLFCVSHVSRAFHRLANDDVLWQKIYTTEFGSRTWKPKSAELKEETVAEQQQQEEEEEESTVSRWKKMYFNMITGQEMKKWMRDLKDLNPYTGLPKRTEWVLRNMNVSWELTLCSCSGWESTSEQSRAHFFESSVILSWSRGFYIKHHHISSIQLYGVRKEASKSPQTRPGWRSQILNLNIKTSPCRLIGKDRLIKVLFFKPSIIIGIWRGQDQVAFVMISLHFYKLVEKSLLGSPVCPYSEPADPPPVGDSDPELGLHGYTLHLVLHNTGTKIMSGHFHQLSCLKAQIQRGLLEMRVISRTDLSQHRSLSGSIRLPWRSDELEGAVENCCFMTLTLLDEFQKLFWCISTPIYICMKNRVQSFDYSGSDFLMEHQDSDGRVMMKLVWLEEQKQFFLINLTVYISAAKVNERFSRAY